MKKKKNANGRSSTSKEIYVETRTRKDGSFVNDKAARVIILMTSDLLLCCLMVVGSYPLHLKKSTMDTTQTFVYLGF
ncbi:hypothetical protein P8452_31743 [Trifolium repens]|nr:hypothetical protein P8452_31743 [Trifolium repens]